MKPDEMKGKVLMLVASGKLADFLLSRIETKDLREFLEDEGLPSDDLFVDLLETEIESRITTSFREE